MRKCKCGNQVSRSAKFCPQCGHRFTSGSTKLLTGVILFCGLAALIGIISAGSNPTPTQSAALISASPPAPPPKPKTAADLIAVRKAYAKVIDQQLLDMGIESKTYTVGPQAKTLVIEDVLAGRVRENAIQKADSLFDNLGKLGFSKLEYRNGLDGELAFGVVWTIKP